MKLLKKTKMLISIFCILHNGCVAAIPVLYGIAIGLPWLTLGYVLTSLAIDAISSAKKKHPEVSFEKKWPECVGFDKDFDTLFQASRQVVLGLNEEIDKEDKEKGIIETKKAVFGEPQAVKEDPSKKVFFWQRETITISKLGDTQAQVCIKVQLSTTMGAQDEEKPLEDEEGVNVVRAIFFDKLEQSLKQKN